MRFLLVYKAIDSNDKLTEIIVENGNRANYIFCASGCCRPHGQTLRQRSRLTSGMDYEWNGMDE